MCTAQQEVNKSKDIEAQLQFNNHLLEQKVRERTYDLTKMNERLESHHHNLAFAHETAGIRPWDWDIEKQKLEITFLINKNKLKILLYTSSQF